MADAGVTLTIANWLSPGNLRAALRGDPGLVPTRPIRRGDGPTRPLPRGDSVDLSDVRVRLADGSSGSLTELLTASAVDAYLVLLDGHIIYERYFDGMTAATTHQWASMTKSVNGLVAAALARRGVIDLSSPATRYVPELADSPFGRATLQQNLDMEVAFDWPADMTEADWMAAVGLLPMTPRSGCGIRQFLPRVGSIVGTPHGSCFRYCNSTTEAVAWAMTNATGRTWAELAEAEVWSRIGAERNANVVLDAEGVEQASGGMSSTPLDLARLGEVLRRALSNDADPLTDVATAAPQLVAAAAAALAPYDNADRFAAGNITAGREGFSYRNGFFHVNDGTGAVQMSGRFGQRVHIDPLAGVTVVQLASFPGAGDPSPGSFLHGVRAVIHRCSKEPRTK